MNTIYNEAPGTRTRDT